MTSSGGSCWSRGSACASGPSRGGSGSCGQGWDGVGCSRTAAVSHARAKPDGPGRPLHHHHHHAHLYVLRDVKQLEVKRIYVHPQQPASDSGCSSGTGWQGRHRHAPCPRLLPLAAAPSQRPRCECSNSRHPHELPPFPVLSSSLTEQQARCRPQALTGLAPHPTCPPSLSSR